MKAALRGLWEARSLSIVFGWMVAFMAMAIAGTPVTATADTIAYWHFNNTSVGDAPDTIVADIGSGAIDSSQYNPTALTFSGSGTTVNAQPGVVAGNRLSFGGPGDSVNSPLYIHISMTGYESLQVSFAARRGFSTNFFPGSEWAWATDADPGNFTVIPGTNTVAASTTFALQQLDLSSVSALNNASTVILRHVWTGATGGLGSQHWDNLLFSGTAIPAPGALALLGVAAFVGSRRRMP